MNSTTSLSKRSQPPRLAGLLSSWDRMVSRCLKILFPYILGFFTNPYLSQGYSYKMVGPSRDLIKWYAVNVCVMNNDEPTWAMSYFSQWMSVSYKMVAHGCSVIVFWTQLQPEHKHSRAAGACLTISSHLTCWAKSCLSLHFSLASKQGDATKATQSRV